MLRFGLKSMAVGIACAVLSACAAHGAVKETFGAPKGDALGLLGGGKSYKRIVTRGDYVVKTPWELMEALGKAKAGQVVYVDDNAEIDMTVPVIACKAKLVVPAGVTLASGRGHKGSPGALIFSDEQVTIPMIEAGGEKVRITGLRLRGPNKPTRKADMVYILNHPDVVKDNKYYPKILASRCVSTLYPDLEVDNCEISCWGHAGVYGAAPATLHVHHCDIHHCQRIGYGYGVCLGNGCVALIEANKFDYVRHAIAGTGRPGTSYEARNNWCGKHSIAHFFDMHGSLDSRGQRWDGKDIAGDSIKIHHNTFEGEEYAAVGIRGVPRVGCEVNNNWFARPDKTKMVWQANEQGNMHIHDNVCGKDKQHCAPEQYSTYMTSY